MAAKQGLTEEVKRYDLLATKIRQAFNEQFYDPVKKDYNSQTANAMALQFGLVPDGDAVAVIENTISDIFENHDGHFSTGHMGSRYLYEQLGKYGYGGVAKTILNQKTYPGMGYLFSKGATTFWESWGEEEIDRNSAGVRSRNHPFQAGYDAWFYKGIGGIKLNLNEPGFKHFILNSDIIGDLLAARVTYNSPYGMIKSNWKIKNEDFFWIVSVPVNTTAKIHIPTTDIDRIFESGIPVIKSQDIEFVQVEGDKTIFLIGSGDYEFSVR